MDIRQRSTCAVRCIKVRGLAEIWLGKCLNADPTENEPSDLAASVVVTPISRLWGSDRGLPIDRYYLERFLERHAGDVRGHVLKLYDDSYTRLLGGERVTRSDVLNVSKGTRTRQ